MRQQLHLRYFTFLKNQDHTLRSGVKMMSCTSSLQSEQNPAVFRLNVCQSVCHFSCPGSDSFSSTFFVTTCYVPLATLIRPLPCFAAVSTIGREIGACTFYPSR
jgi:hypothetical protein